MKCFYYIVTSGHAQVERNRMLLMKGVVVIETAVRVVSTTGDLAERLRPVATTVDDDTSVSEYLGTQCKILAQLKQLAMNRTGDAQSQMIGLEWALLAMIFDRVFLYIFLLVGTAGVTLIALRYAFMV